MKLTIHHVVELRASSNTMELLYAILTAVMRLQKGIDAVSPELERLAAQVKKNSEVQASAIELLKGLSTQLQAAKQDPAAIQELADQISAEADRLASAVTANTPAATGDEDEEPTPA